MKNAATPGSRAPTPPSTAAGDPSPGRTKTEWAKATTEVEIPSQTWVRMGFESGEARFLARRRNPSGRLAESRINATANQPNPIAMPGAGPHYMAMIRSGHQDFTLRQ